MASSSDPYELRDKQQRTDPAPGSTPARFVTAPGQPWWRRSWPLPVGAAVIALVAGFLGEFGVGSISAASQRPSGSGGAGG
ncbi:hypothetical protein [Rathayibacter soli]|uniref:hypothetical protein n=1 Tax=Rathayibacter soli TaxID=3144168 RepID=UPI0027E57C8B|nr:hypothetical protein [Glaciibacter superstes]